MPRREEAFLQQLRATFAVEAREHLQALGEGLVALENTQDAGARSAVIERIFRAAHSLKGASRAVDLRQVEAQCQALEELFAPWKRGDSVPTPGALDQAHRFLDRLATALGTQQVGGSSPPAGRAADGPVAREPARPAPAETVRVPVSRLDERLATSEQLVMAKAAVAGHAQVLRELSAGLAEWRRQWQGVEGHVSGLHRGGATQDAARSAVEFFDWSRDHVRSLEARLDGAIRQARHEGRAVGQLVDDLLDESKRLLLMPFSSITGSLPKLVRDLSREQGKSAELQVAGAEVEIDRRVLEAMKDPLVHLVRNSVDHGIESPEERAAKGKPARAVVSLSITRVDAGKVVLRVGDDGRGIDPALVRHSVVERGLLSREEAAGMSDAAIVDYVFRSGFSTRREVTALSGRGLGLPIVRENAERLGGSVSIAASPGGGTAIEMALPTMLATYRGVLVQAAGQSFVVPSLQVERVARFRMADVKTIEGRAAVADGGRFVPLVTLADVLELPAAGPEPGPVRLAMVLGAGDQRVAFIVDEVVEELEVLVKPFGPPLLRVRNITGATALAGGRLAPILNVPDLLKSARRAAQPATAQPEAGRISKSILVAEDSITSRMLLKGILESAGYAVKTAGDGLEAFGLLRSQRFDLLVSDVDMPRLDGFSLTARIRADPKVSAMPVILLTTLGSDRDRERGFDAGANAYIVKSSFDQGALLETIARLA